ncbi:MAG: Na/Pi cotransporter family protein [Culicoidibacterales bacterium]
MDVNMQKLLFELVGGLGIFLFSIKFMGDGLKNFAGDKIRDWIEKFTNTPVKGALVGILVTGLLQSSSGTTALAISLVRAGLMTTQQSIGIIMGANVGTTITAFLIGLKLSKYALPIMAVGGLIYMFAKNKKLNYISQTIFGFGGLFLGLEIMSKGLLPIAELPQFSQFMVDLSFSPFLAILVGTVLTMVVQSSSATIGILQSLYGGGVISLQAALPILYGDNIGTTITSVLASIGGSTAAKRTAASHVIFNVLGSVLFTLLLIPYYHFVSAAAQMFGLTPEMQIAFAHAGFNITMTLLLLPFADLLAKLVTKLIKPTAEELAMPDMSNFVLDQELIEQSPSFALVQVKHQVIAMAQFARQSVINANNYAKSGSLKDLERLKQTEGIVDTMDKKIAHYLIEIGTHTLSEEEGKLQATLLKSIRDLERISDHAINISEHFELKFDNKEHLTPQGFEEYNQLINSAIEMLNLTIQALEEDSAFICGQVIERENELDKMVLNARENYIERLKNQELNGMKSFVFTDIISDIERIGDHAANICDRLAE